MSEILSTFEQFCKKNNKNVVLKEIFHNDGSFEIVCTNSGDCSNDCLCIKRLNYYKSFNNNQK